jgi:hypothetical protein
MKTNFIISTLILSQCLFAINARSIDRKGTIDSNQSKLPQHIAILSGEVNGLNEECKSVPLSQDTDENWKMENKFKFTDRGRAYELVYSWKLPDSTSLCLLTGTSATPMFSKPGAYIDRVDRVRGKIFTFQIHEGNGNKVPATKYRLDLSQPQNPKLKVLKRWIMK